MAARTYSDRVIVLRKTKLREADLIVTMIAQDGRQVRAVAKGALKPAGSFASRLELFACVDALFVEGKSLDIIKEARFVNAHAPLRFDYDRNLCAAPVVELLSHATQDELPVDRLFAMTEAVLSALEQADVSRLALLTVAYLLKASSLLGFRPSMRQCAECGNERMNQVPWGFSFVAGGVVCGECALRLPVNRVSPAIVDWADTLLLATFAEIQEMEADSFTLRELLLFTQSWLQTHICHLKSLAFLVSQMPHA